MLSLSPRLDLFDFSIPKTFFPEEIIAKYDNIISSNKPCVIKDSLNYLNESIVGFSLPGLSDLNIYQYQISKFNPVNTKQFDSKTTFTTEPFHENKYQSSENILAKIEKQFTITFRLNQGLLNYFMIYETAFHRYCRPYMYDSNDVFELYLKNESGKYIAKIIFKQPQINSIDGLEFSMNKVERGSETFNVIFDFNNIDFDFLYEGE